MEVDKKKIGAGFAGAWQKAADAAKAAKLTVQDMTADAKQSREKKKADAQKAAAAKEIIAAAESEKSTPSVVKCIATQNALQIIYYLMAVDGTVYHSEEEKFDAIGAELDPNFADSKPAIIRDCQIQLEKVIDPEDYYDVLQDGVEDAIQSSRETADTFITPKLLIWNLLTIAYSDESYDETERKLLKYIVRKLQIDKAVFLEMESSILTILDAQRLACGNSLTRLGAEKMTVLNGTISDFLNVFTQIKNVDFKETEGLDELHRLHIDEQEFVELRSMAHFAGFVAGGAVAGTAGGALAAFGAYGAAQALAFASTGTAISALSGAAATNATLAFFGGGSLAAGGLGMAGGTAVLGGLVAGPALLVMGLVAGKAAKKGLEKAYTNRAEAVQIAAQLNTASLQCETIRRRTYVFYNLLARLDSYFMPLIYQMSDIVKAEGDDYRCYSADSKKIIASCASVAVSIKSVSDTPLLTDDGTLTEASEGTTANVEGFLKNLKIPY